MIIFPNKELKEFMKNKGNKYINGPHITKQFPVDDFYDSFSEEIKEKTLKCTHITWHTTKNCNMNCIHCGVNGGEKIKNEITVEEIIKHIPDFKKLGVKYFTITGGEPLLKKGLFKLIENLKKNGIFILLSTNLFKLSAKDLEMLKLVDSIMISLDGFKKEHEEIRNVKCFEHIVKNIKKINNIGIPIFTISTVAYKGNLKTLEKFKKYVFSLGINSRFIKPILPYGRAKDNTSLLLNKQELKQLYEFCSKGLYEGYDIIIGDDIGYLGKYDNILKMGRSLDLSGRNSLYIMENGDIKGSDLDFLPIEGNILQNNIKDIRDKKFKKYRNRKLISSKCKKCKYYNDCGGGYLPTLLKAKDCKIDSFI